MSSGVARSQMGSRTDSKEVSFTRGSSRALISERGDSDSPRTVGHCIDRLVCAKFAELGMRPVKNYAASVSSGQ